MALTTHARADLYPGNPASRSAALIRSCASEA